MARNVNKIDDNLPEWRREKDCLSRTKIDNIPINIRERTPNCVYNKSGPELKHPSECASNRTNVLFTYCTA